MKRTPAKIGVCQCNEHTIFFSKRRKNSCTIENKIKKDISTKLSLCEGSMGRA